ncbi:MAG: CBS domain-containing protein [Saprospiraceae bacterium]|nr:CBS domain-containing protein [Saprospiraceae bacterium]
MDYYNKITEIMSVRLTTIHPKDNIGKAEMLFKNIDKNVLPVVVNNELKGILLRRDFKSLARTKNYINTRLGGKFTAQNMTVEDFMTREVKVLLTEKTIKDAIQFFIDYKQYFIPILDGREIVGIVTPHDVFKFILSTQFNS